MSAADEAASTRDVIARRNRLLGPAYRLFYEQPVHFVRGEGVWLYDADGRRYLDAYNNVASVGHCHPHVVRGDRAAGRRRSTPTRAICTRPSLDYAERLLATFPPELGHVMFTCTGSEANDLALRVAEPHRRHRLHRHRKRLSRRDQRAGRTLALARAVASGRQSRATGPGAAPRVDNAGDDRLPRHVGAALADLQRHAASARRRCSSTRSSPATASSPIRPAFCARRSTPCARAGGLFIADEVQPGFGRTRRSRCGALPATASSPTSSPWASRWATAIPSPGMAARPDLLAEFGRRSRYFNTFGGNPVSAAAGIAVLDVIEAEGLVENAQRTGAYLFKLLGQLQARHELIAEVRGAGLFVGVELRRGGAAGAPATTEAARIVNLLRERRVLISTAGPHGNVLKIRPPLVFGTEHADLLVESLDQALAELYLTSPQ